MAVMAVFSVLLFALPKQESSRLEFKPLAADPFRGKSAEKLVTELVQGKMSANVDKYLEEHYPARDFFIALNSYFLRLTGRNADQSVVMGKNGRLFAPPIGVEDDKYVRTNIQTIDSFASQLGLDTAVVIVPSSGAVLPEDLPLVHGEYRDAELIDSIRGMTDAYVPDLISLFSSAEEKEGLMYRTDHHWTMDGAALCFRDLCAHFGDEPVNKADFSVSGYEFYGYYYRNAGLWMTKPDTLEIWRSPELDSARVTIGLGDEADVWAGVYDETKLAEGEIDRYAAYLWSNNGLTVIENPNGNGETIMLVKDSFGNSIATLLASVYSRVVMIDTRHYTFSVYPSELCEEYGIEKLVVVFGLDSAVSDMTIGALRVKKAE